MRASRNLLLTLFFLCSVPTWAGDFDYRVLIGEWATFDAKRFGDPWYQYLRINEKYEGVFAYSYGDPPAISFHFTQKDIRLIDGVAVITLRRAGCPDWRLVLSAFRSPEVPSGLVTGTMFMFKDNNGTPALFNSIFVRLEPLELNKALQAKPEIRKHREQLGNVQAVESLPVRLEASLLPAGVLVKFQVNDLPVFVLNRRPNEIASLRQSYAGSKERVTGCAACDPVLRSISPSYLVVWGYNPSSGCGLTYVSSTATDWVGHSVHGRGGFVDKCSETEYDLSGRKLVGPKTSPNELRVPSHSFHKGVIEVEAKPKF